MGHSFIPYSDLQKVVIQNCPIHSSHILFQLPHNLISSTHTHTHTYIYIYIYYQIMLIVRNPLILSRYPSLSFISRSNQVTATSKEIGHWWAIVGMVLFGAIPLGLAATVFFMTIYPTAHVIFWSQEVSRLPDEITEETNRSMASGCIKNNSEICGIVVN